MLAEARGQSGGGEDCEEEVGLLGSGFSRCLLAAAPLRKVNHDDSQAEKLRQEEEVGGSMEKRVSILLLSLFALLFAYVRVRPSARLAEGRRPDRRDEAARATLVSSPEHHPSSWELSA